MASPGPVRPSLGLQESASPAAAAHPLPALRSAGSAQALLHAGWFNTAVREVQATPRAWLCRQPAVQAPLQNTLLPCVLTVRRRIEAYICIFFFRLNLKCIVLPGRRGTWWSTGASSTCVLYTGRSSSAGREVSDQYPAILLPKKIPIFLKNSIFHGCSFSCVGSRLEGGGVGVLHRRLLSNPGTSPMLGKM